jgi:hypothetical protein
MKQEVTWGIKNPKILKAFFQKRTNFTVGK